MDTAIVFMKKNNRRGRFFFKLSLILVGLFAIVLFSLFFSLHKIFNQQVLLTAVLTAFIISIVLSLLVSRSIAQPIEKMAAVTKAISRGDFHQRAVSATADELQDIASSINDITTQMRTRMDDVATNQSRLEAVFLS